MPTDHVEMMEGRTINPNTKLVAKVTRVRGKVLGGEAEAVDGIITKTRSARLIGRK